MKKVRIFLVLAITSLIAFTSCNQSKPVKTIENLKAGIIGETTASKKYEAFAQKAKEEGHDAIAMLFSAASNAEAVHAANHTKVLESLGEKMDDFTPEFEVKTTAENLQAAIEGESYEVATMYPQFLADAKAEKVQKAEQSFTWALDTEKKHNDFYSNALSALNAESESGLPTGYAVCPVCGNTYDMANVDDKCAFCMTDKSKFINFD
ncbi:rubrerythrin family protein [Prolixibacter denitrificans]|uniref:Rubrerythrin n=1 Tax=Prolixibacter denitrificans TaxID=1541063 RepID=A0A2P8CFB6_9BACT|nr:ferritin family protein [Prolixibacter denitrificans]PSK83668.1 rubrerythrin [Prolixibacter denitrificans]GET23214.1 rubrerythrin [Prolixibacter denitrificans]